MTECPLAKIYEEVSNWDGLISPTLSNKVFPICHPVSLPTSFWFLMTPLTFQKITQQFSLVYLIFTDVYYFFFLPYLMVLHTALWNLVVHFVMSTLYILNTYDFTSFVASGYQLLDCDWAESSNKCLVHLQPSSSLVFYICFLGSGLKLSFPIFLKFFPLA